METTTINCPNCTKLNYTSASKCWNCQTPLDSQNLLKEQISKQFDCPRCHSQNTSSFEMIYQSGTAKGRFSSVSYGGDVGLVSTGGVSQSQSLLAQQVAPPKLESGGCINLLIAFAILSGGFIFGNIFGHIIFNQAKDGIRAAAGLIIGLAIGISGVIAFAGDVAKKNKLKHDLWEPEHKKWQNSWMCRKCGHRWILENSHR